MRTGRGVSLGMDAKEGYGDSENYRGFMQDYPGPICHVTDEGKFVSAMEGLADDYIKRYLEIELEEVDDNSVVDGIEDWHLETPLYPSMNSSENK
jgi:hypothetical protein